MKSLNYGKGYKYAHEEEGKVANMQCLPDNLRDRRYYHPTREGREKLLAQRMEEIRRIREGHGDGEGAKGRGSAKDRGGATPGK